VSEEKEQKPKRCPRCGAILKYLGSEKTKEGPVLRYQCWDCGEAPKFKE
jgi:hypothetical protein